MILGAYLQGCKKNLELMILTIQLYDEKMDINYLNNIINNLKKYKIEDKELNDIKKIAITLLDLSLINYPFDILEELRNYDLKWFYDTPEIKEEKYQHIININSSKRVTPKRVPPKRVTPKQVQSESLKGGNKLYKKDIYIYKINYIF